MMTIDEARRMLLTSEPGHACVLYRPRCGHTEEGVITRVSGTWVFVRYGDARAAQATDPADLEPLPAG